MADPFEGMNAGFSTQLQQLINASGGQVWVTSGYRSPERQQQLWQNALAKYGDPEIADNWVARPGKSNHGRGIAADLGFANAGAREWVHQNAARFGLHFPMSWEPWHIEPSGSVAISDRGAYTTGPGINPRDALDMGVGPDGQVEDPYDLGTQLKRLEMLMNVQPEDEFATPEAGGMESPELGMNVDPTTQEGVVPEVEEGTGYGPVR